MHAGDLVLGDGAVVQIGQRHGHLGAVSELLVHPHAGGHLVLAQGEGLRVEVAGGSLGGQAGGVQHVLIGGGDGAHLVHVLQLALRALQLHGAAVGQEQVHGGLSGNHADGGGAGLSAGGQDGGHLAVHGHQQGDLLARGDLVGEVPGALQHREGVAQQGDGRGGLGAGGGVLILAAQPQVGHQQGVGHAVVGDHVVGLDLGQADGLLVFQNGVACGAAGEPVEVSGAHPVHDHYSVRVGRGGGGSRVDGGHLAPQGEQGQAAAGGEGHIALGVGLPFAGAGGVDGGVGGDGVPAAAHGGEIAGLRVVQQGDGHRGAVVGDKGDDLALVVEDQRPPAAHQGGGGHVLRVGEVGALRGAHRPHGGAVVGLGVDRQQDGVPLGLTAQGGVVVLPLPGLAGEGVDKQLGGLGPGEGVPRLGADPVGEADGLGQIQIAVRPHRPHFVAGVAQHPDEDGHRLGEGELLLRQEPAVAHPGDQRGAGGGSGPLAGRGAPRAGPGARVHHGGGGQSEIPPGPVAGGHVGEDGAGGVEDHLVPQPHEVDRHGAELSPGQLVIGAEGVAPRAGDHPHQTQNVGVHRRSGVAHILKGGGPGRSRREGDHQPGGQGGRQQGVDHSMLFSHRYVLPYSVNLPAGPPPAGGRRP